MNNNGISGREIMPSDGGMGISGKWINKRTGQVVNVMNSVMDGDDMIIISDKGQISMSEFSQDYIQTSDEIYDEAGNLIGKEPINTDDFKQIQEYEQINKSSINNSMKNKAKNKAKDKETTQEDPNIKIIKKVFDKLTSYPTITIDVKWDDFPEAQIHTLVDYLDISIDDISTYIIKKYINIDSLSANMKNIINTKLKKNIGIENDNEE